MICQECGVEIEGNEYHPLAFCVLIKAGLDPLTVVLEAVSRLTAILPDTATCPNCDDKMDLMVVCPSCGTVADLRVLGQ